MESEIEFSAGRAVQVKQINHTKWENITSFFFYNQVIRQRNKNTVLVKNMYLFCVNIKILWLSFNIFMYVHKTILVNWISTE